MLCPSLMINYIQVEPAPESIVVQYCRASFLKWSVVLRQGQFSLEVHGYQRATYFKWSVVISHQRSCLFFSCLCTMEWLVINNLVMSYENLGTLKHSLTYLRVIVGSR